MKILNWDNFTSGELGKMLYAQFLGTGCITADLKAIRG